MSASLTVQYAVIALAVLVSAWVVLKKHFPDVARRMLVTVAVPMVRSGRPAWLRSLGQRLAPPRNGSAGTCGGCDNCGPGKD